jgi:hypothetical protein
MRLFLVMKKILFHIILLNSLLSISQNTVKIEVNWQKDTALDLGSYRLNIPQFQQKSFFFDDINKSIHFNYKFEVSSPIDESSVKISSLEYENISQDELGDLSLKNIPTNINLTLKNGKARDLLQVLLTFSPLIKTNEGYKKVKSFSFNYVFSTNYLQRNETSFDFNNIQNSVLATGDWYRFYVVKSGVYKISRSFLNQLGMNTNVDPRSIKIYGNGGRMIPLLNSIEYSSDLVENAILFVGEDDGVFNPEDYILFYAEGMDNWNSESLTHLNLYDDKSYYYVTAQGGNGKRITDASQPSDPASTILTTFNDYQFFERDVNNIGRIGRTWYGEQLSSQTPLSVDFNFPNIVNNSTVQLTVNAAAISLAGSNLSINAGGGQSQVINFNAIPTFSSLLFSSGTAQFNIASVQDLQVHLTYNNNGVPSARGYLNYIIAKAQRNLQGYGKQFRFQNESVASLIGVGEFQLSNTSAIQQVWDITDIFNVSRYQNSGNSAFSFKVNLGETRKYIAIDPSDYYNPLRESQSKVLNQDIKGTIFNNAQGQFQDIDYLIISPLNLASEAERLANFHRNFSNLNVKVVTLDKIYQEFSSGKQDIGAIRNLVKYVYFNASENSKRVKYLNLFGDASFDYKNRIPNNTNIVPIFHSLNSESLLSSTMTDDFFGMMDPNEGRMLNQSSLPGFEALDIAVGRMLVSSVQQAKEMVDKVIQYHDNNSYGRWRNNFTLVSDDVDESWENQIQTGIDNLGNTINTEKPFVNVLKFHADSYVQEASAGGQRYPKLKQELFNAIQNGSLVFNYFGHGGEDQLASERIFEKIDAQNLNNQYRYPLIVTVTCEFTRFDNPYRQTAGEFTYWNPTGGAISLITTTRQIGVTTGQQINEGFSSFLYGYGPNSNEDITIAEALRRAKNAYNSLTLMVFYIGDPALKLAIPKPKIILTKVNDIPADSSTLVFNALSKVKLSGEF